MSIETMVGHGVHLLSDHLGGITGVHYKVNNSLLILPASAGSYCMYTLYYIT